MSPSAALATQAAQALQARRLRNAAFACKVQDTNLWMESCWTLNGDPATPYRLDGYAYLREIGNSTAEEITVMSGAGTGKTEYFLGWGLAHASWGDPVIYCFESDKKTGLLVQERVNPNFRRNPFFKSINKGESDNIQLKKLGKSHAYFLGLGNDGATASYHGKKLVLDELDRMDLDRVAMMRKRLATAGRPMVRKLSNPSFPDFGIDEEWKRSDQRRWFVKCEACGKAAALGWHTHVDEKALVVRCPSCKKPMDRLRVVANGWWQPTNPKGDHPGYHLHRLMTPVCNLQAIRDELASEKERTKAAAVRMDLGLPFQEKGGGISDSEIKAADAGPVWQQEAKGGFMVCDPGAVFDVQIYERPIQGRPLRCVWAGTVSGFPELASLADSAGIRWGMIDFMPELTGAKDFVKNQAAKGQTWWRASYSGPDQDDSPAWRHDTQNADLIEIGRTLALDEFRDALQKQQILYPTRLVTDTKSRLYAHLKAPRRVVEFDKKGRPRIFWVHDENRPDHQFHCGVYAWILGKLALTQGGSSSVEIVDGSW